MLSEGAIAAKSRHRGAVPALGGLELQHEAVGSLLGLSLESAGIRSGTPPFSVQASARIVAARQISRCRPDHS